MEKKEFMYAFQISKKVVFEVHYYTVGNNSTPYFSTTAAEFNQPKTDFDRCGQAQEALLPKDSFAFEFWKKWEAKHLADLSDDEYNELINDIEKLKEEYNFIYSDLSKKEKPYDAWISFYQLKSLSMEKVKNTKKHKR